MNTRELVPIYRDTNLAPIVPAIMIVIHTTASPLPVSGYSPDAPAVKAAIACLLAYGLIVPDADSPTGFESTVKGREWVRAICRVPFSQPAISA